LLSAPVMLGFMNGAAVVIIVSQLGKLCGFSLAEDNTLLKLFEWITRLGKTKWLTLTLGAATIALLAAIPFSYTKVPVTILVFVLALVAGRSVDFTSHEVAIIGTVDTNLPSPVPPELSLADVGRLLTAALGLALLIFPEGILLGRVMADQHKY